VFQIGIVIGGHYVGNTGTEDTVVTISKPLDGFITGGGFSAVETLANAVGLYGSATDGKANFGFNAKLNKKNTKSQGRATIIVRADGRAYLASAFRTRAGVSPREYRRIFSSP